MVPVLLFGVLIPFAVASSGGVRPGSLDPAFGRAGITTTAVGQGSGAYALGLQSNGKIIAGGRAIVGADYDFALVRYTTRGLLDPTFGNSGSVTTDFGTSGEVITAIAIQPDQKIVAAGGFEGDRGDFLLARYRSDGSLDPTFGKDGKVETPVAPAGNANDVALQQDGKIVVVGTTNYVCCDPSMRDGDFVIARYNRDGSLDTSFGKGGLITTDFGGDEWANAVAVLPDGKLLVAGGKYTDIPGIGPANYRLLARYRTNGSIDHSFGKAGKAVTQDGDTIDLAVLKNGNVVVTGGWQLARYNANGSLDSRFGHGGSEKDLSANDDHLALQPDGKIVTSGWRPSQTGPAAIAVTRYLPNGARDQSFGHGGTVRTYVGAKNSFAFGIALQRHAKIVVGGFGGDRSTTDFAVMRYIGGPYCRVPRVINKTLLRSRHAIRLAHCQLGHITRQFSDRVKKGRVISQHPRARRIPRAGTKIRLLVSKGRSSRH